jgi:hypothetical protein
MPAAKNVAGENGVAAANVLSKKSLCGMAKAAKAAERRKQHGVMK